MQQHKVGILTGGGDCPGLNAVIRAVVQKIANAGGECVGLVEGWRGLVQANMRVLKVLDTDGIIARGGTILGSSRANPDKQPADVAKCVEDSHGLGLTALGASGVDATPGVASRPLLAHQQPTVG